MKARSTLDLYFAHSETICAGSTRQVCERLLPARNNFHLKRIMASILYSMQYILCQLGIKIKRIAFVHPLIKVLAAHMKYLNPTLPSSGVHCIHMQVLVLFASDYYYTHCMYLGLC